MNRTELLREKLLRLIKEDKVLEYSDEDGAPKYNGTHTKEWEDTITEFYKRIKTKR
jgi:hypothetical protein